LSEEESYNTVRATLKEEQVEPYSEAEMEIVHSVEQCINCGICLNHCPVVAAVGVDRFTGPRSIAVELSRTPPEYWSTADKVYLCTGCGTCREVCPNNVNIPEIVNLIRARIFKFRPDLVPKGLQEEDMIIREHNLAFKPWKDEEDKIDSRDMRLERLGLPYIPDIVKVGAKVLFYPGCQAEEIAQEVREATKVILDHFEVDFTVLEDLSCCGLPARLIGDDEKARELARILNDKITQMGVQKIVTTCAGCTSNLGEIAHRDKWVIPVYHILEFLMDEIGLERLSNAFKEAKNPAEVAVAIHDPCHLIRHTSRQILDYAIQILKEIPGVAVTSSQAHDSCCGGGGLVARHAPDVSRAVVQENLESIKKTSSNRVVTPCPLCTAQIEDNLFRSGSDIEVDDLTVFIAQRLPIKR
jgi:Fe-S oxidoreductase